ncbi:MAG: triose-phosphate isomerase [Gemmatimonadota bacterium]
MSAVRPPVIAGNWKMHHAPQAARAFGSRLADALGEPGPTVALFPPALSLAALAEGLGAGTPVRLGVQHIHWKDSGAFTGEVSAPMAAAAGATLALVGHSERRHLFGETDEETARKVGAAFEAGLTPVLCVGETEAQRDAGEVEAVLARQLDAVTARLDDGRLAALVLAYEPVWAIGTGRTATPGDASAAHEVLRARLTARLGAAAAGVPVLYGGSVKPANAAELLRAPEVGGVLVGGASLQVESFAAIVAAAPASADGA